MKHLKYINEIYNYKDDDILGVKVGDGVFLTVNSISNTSVVKNVEYTISKIFGDNKMTELSIVNDTNDFIELEGIDSGVIRVHYFTPAIIYQAKKYNI